MSSRPFFYPHPFSTPLLPVYVLVHSVSLSLSPLHLLKSWALAMATAGRLGNPIFRSIDIYCIAFTTIPHQIHRKFSLTCTHKYKFCFDIYTKSIWHTGSYTVQGNEWKREKSVFLANCLFRSSIFYF